MNGATCPLPGRRERLNYLNDWNVWNHCLVLDISNDRNRDPALDLELGTLNFNGRKALNVWNYWNGPQY